MLYNWARGIAVVNKVNNTNPISYELKDLYGEDNCKFIWIWVK